MILTLLTLALLGFATTAAAYDLYLRRIPNRLVVAGFAAALVLRALMSAAAHQEGWLGAGLAFLLAFPLFAIGAVGGGDAKLFIMVGAFLGPKGLLAATLVTGVAGGILALVEIVRRGAVLGTLRSTLALVGYGLTLGRRGTRVTLASPGAVTVPYGVAIAVGAVAGWLL